MSTIELEKPELRNDSANQDWDDLPDWVRRDIAEAEQQLDAGFGIPHEVVMAEMRQWLEEN